jgi:hypothetical protein
MPRVLLAGLACLSLASGALAQGQDRNPTGAISGVVIDAVTGQPVAGAAVSLSQIDALGQPAPRVMTDQRGRFVFSNLDASDGYFLGARRFGYAPTRYGWTGPNQSLTIRDIKRVKVADGQWVSDITIPLWRLASLSGRVLDERGEPMVGVAVRVFSRRPIAGSVQLVAGPIATTDDRGAYRIIDLDPGAYHVALLSVQSTVLDTTPDAPPTVAVGQLATGGIGGGRGNAVSVPTVDVDGRHRLAIGNFGTPPPPSSTESRAYPPVFYPGVRSVADAAALELNYGDVRTNVDFQAQPAPVVRVSGRLEGWTERPNFLLRLLPRGAEQLGFGAEVATTVCDADGSFTFLNVAEGDYTLLVQASVMDFTSGSTSTRFPDAPGFPQGGITVGSQDAAPGLGYLSRHGAANARWARHTVSVGTRNIDDLVVALRQTVTIRGRVVLAEGVAPPARNRVLMHAVPANGDPTLGQPSGGTVADDPTMALTIGGLLGGTYLLAPFQRFGIVSIVASGRDVTYTGFDASAGDDFDDVVVTLTDKLGAITGRVEGLNDASRTAAVIVFPVERERWTNFGWDPPQFRTARASAEGAFTIEDLPAGNYHAIAVDAVHMHAWLDPEWLATAAPLSARVSLGWGDKREVTVSFVERVSK